MTDRAPTKEEKIADGMLADIRNIDKLGWLMATSEKKDFLKRAINECLFSLKDAICLYEKELNYDPSKDVEEVLGKERDKDRFDRRTEQPAGWSFPGITASPNQVMTD